MNRLPVIVGFGGYNAAGRSSFHHAFRRTVLGSLDGEKRVKTLLSLATLMNLVQYKDGRYSDNDGLEMSAEQVADKISNHNRTKHLDSSHTRRVFRCRICS